MLNKKKTCFYINQKIQTWMYWEQRFDPEEHWYWFYISFQLQPFANYNFLLIESIIFNDDSIQRAQYYLNVSYLVRFILIISALITQMFFLGQFFSFLLLSLHNVIYVILDSVIKYFFFLIVSKMLLHIWLNIV